MMMEYEDVHFVKVYNYTTHNKNNQSLSLYFK